MKLKLAYPITPYIVNQPWGVHRPEVYEPFGFTDHNGVDLRLSPSAEIRAEFPCEAIRTLWQPNGGGLTLGVLSDDEYDFDDGIRCRVLIDYLHLKVLKKSPGGDYKIKTGEVLAFGDNTGFSTGPHCHIQYRRVYKTPNGLVNVDKNNANGSFNPEPYRTVYESDNINLGKQLNLIQSIVDAIKKWQINNH